MKKISIYILFVLVFTSCNYLDYDENTFYEKEDIFTSFGRTKDFLTNLYGFLPVEFTNFGGGMRASACDEAVEAIRESDVHQFNDGSWSPLSTRDDVWSTYYNVIRAANMFLEEGTDKKFEEYENNKDYVDMMKQYRNYPYEARFLRAFYYFELVKRYGDVPLVTKVLTEKEANNVERTPYAQVMEFITEECDTIAKYLPVEYNNTGGMPVDETGRATKGAALALKSKVLLYAASPLFNPGNDKKKWEKAARAAGEVISRATEFGYTPLPDLNSIINNTYSNELILYVRQGDNNAFEYHNFPVGTEGAQSGTCPTQNLVDAFEMKESGLPVSATAGYEHPDPSYRPQDPYTGRDPRLYTTVALNNTTWVYNEVLECWYGGKNGKPQRRATETGYYLKKFVDGTTNLTTGNVTRKRHVWIIMRYTEILLNYAEAMVEAFGDPDYKGAGLDLSAREAVNRVRKRPGVNMPDFPASLSQEEFIRKLRNERQVELAFEGHRYWDVRRWKIADQTTAVYGMDITKNNDNTFSYQKIRIEDRVFKDYMYLYPVPKSEIYINPKLTQNPGWDD